MMLAEKLLLEKGGHLPTRERDVLHAMDTMGEPHSIVVRRKARRAWFEANRDSEPAIARMAAEMSKLHRDFDSFDGVHSSNYVHESSPESEEDVSYDVEVFTKALISTGGLYRLDGGEEGTQGVLDSIWGGLPMGELPPLPYPRVWIEARGKNGEYVPLWQGTPEGPEGRAWNDIDAATLWGIGISEIVTGQSWVVIAMRQEEWTYESPRLYPKYEGHVRKPVALASPRYERVDARDLAYTPQSQNGMFVYDGTEIMQTEFAYRGAMTAWALVLADIITARNVDRREQVMSRRWHKQLQRRAPGGRYDPRLYNVSIATATGDPKDETHRALSVRFLVRGHWRVSETDHATWVESKEAFCVWVHAHVKGPPGAPWKGRPVYVEPRT